MKTIRTVLGLNMGHNGGCALCVDGTIVVAISEERLVRQKNTHGWLYALRYCLQAARLSLSDIDLIVFSNYGQRLPDNFDGDLSAFGVDVPGKTVTVDHHLSHACATFFSSPFRESIVFIYDGSGNGTDTESIYKASGNTLTKVAGNPIPDTFRGITRAYSYFNAYFGWTIHDSGKTMGLASYGDALRYAEYSIYSKNRDGWYYNNFQHQDAEGVSHLLDVYAIDAPPPFLTNKMEYADLAAWAQVEFERAILGTIDNVGKAYDVSRLCIAGGGALNSVCNRKILSDTDVEHLFAFPASGDDGECIGNALYGYYVYGENNRDDFSQYRSFHGKEYDTQSIIDRLESRRGLRSNLIPGAPQYTYQRLNNPARTAASLIANGDIIGWFQGGSEFGPRALGHRSILCDPRKLDMKERLNEKVKHREKFRPFAASVLTDSLSEYFEINVESPYMLIVPRVKKEKIAEIPSVVHVDETCRVQTVDKKDGIYHELLANYKKLTGVPLVLNTSLNVAGEPIVETPLEAIQCLLKTDLDHLIVNDILVSKT